MTDDATMRQNLAARPFTSTWVSANAGSGKTRVLTNRVARLLFQGVSPTKILCLTYTKAAASEMQIRLFQTLGEWSMLTDEPLEAELLSLGELGPFSTADLKRARQMFATAIETPGGLKIQTIHAFCSNVLRRFPLESGLSPGFREMDEKQGAAIRAGILDEIALSNPDVFDPVAIDAGGNLEALCIEIGSNAGFFENFTEEKAWQGFGLEPSVSVDDLVKNALDGGEKSLVERVKTTAAATTPAYIKFANRLGLIDFNDFGLAAFWQLAELCLYKSGEKTGLSKASNFPQSNHTKVVDAFAQVAPDLHALMDRVEAVSDQLKARQNAQRTVDLGRFAALFLESYERRKSVMGLLDFNDLIEKTFRLFESSEASQWVLFRLDGGVDHILIDEAQDTSPRQWQVIEALEREFTAGLGAREGVWRTIFAVGDRKQSIYSFQGARPQAFDDMSVEIAGRLASVDQELARVELSHSFRSSPAILSFVDKALEPYAQQGLGDHLSHIAFQDTKPGRVDVWPLIAPTKDKSEPADFSDPVDLVAPDHPGVQLAAQIAQEITEILDRGDQIVGKNGPRPVRPGDFLILVQRRSGVLFTEVLRRLKAAGLPVAGSDVLRLDDELAVQDLLSVLRFLAYPADDLSLAEIMRSPLMGLTEQNLYDVAQGRPAGQTLWQAFLARTSKNDNGLAILQELLGNSEFRTPYELLDRVLTRHKGRERLIARLGAECEDGIDALLSLALNFEAREVPSLVGFLSWMSEDKTRVKRQTDNAGDLIRVMTTHGAKGLEAPIVILPDTGVQSGRSGRNAILTDAGGVIWKAVQADQDSRTKNAVAAAQALENEERLRLLYVAMTRAESWLIVCGAGDEKETTWHSIMDHAMENLANSQDASGRKRYAAGTWPKAAPQPEIEPAVSSNLPDWTQEKAATAPRKPQTVSPSELGGAKALPGEGEDNEGAMARGTALHRLLEHLPREPRSEWSAISARELGDRVDREALFSEVVAVLEGVETAHLFDDLALFEVPVLAKLPSLEGQQMLGSIDLLRVSDDAVLIVDFKSNRQIPKSADEMPSGILRQLGAYAEAMSAIYPDKTIETAVLWTKSASLMSVSHDIVRDALAATAAS